MITQENISIVIQISTLVGMIFGVYLYFRKPQEKSETTDAVFEERMKNYESSTEKAIQLALNHSHTVEAKLDLHISQSSQKGIEDARWQGRVETLLENLVKKQ
jgi:predicted histidine transporter YuiF (NhaC family)